MFDDSWIVWCEEVWIIITVTCDDNKTNIFYELEIESYFIGYSLWFFLFACPCSYDDEALSKLYTIPSASALQRIDDNGMLTRLGVWCLVQIDDEISLGPALWVV